jgi:hypothetical protein
MTDRKPDRGIPDCGTRTINRDRSSPAAVATPDIERARVVSVKKATIDKATLRRAAIMWAFVVRRQADRLYEAVGELIAAAHDQVFLDALAAGTLSDEWTSYVEEQVGEGMSWGVAWDGRG